MVGPNGQGKTNLLEAMYYVVALESPRIRSDLPLVRVGASSAYLRTQAESSVARVLVEVEIRASGANRVVLNRSPVRRKRDVRRHVRAVFSGPDDLSVVAGEPDERRRFMDEAVRALWPLKEGAAAAYERALRQRNRLLKDWDGVGEPSGLTAWDAELVTHGVALTELRAAAVAEVAPRATEEFTRLAGDGLAVDYIPSFAPEPDETLGDAFRRRLAERRGDELVRRTTLVGPHRDELSLVVEELAARSFASHGEAWAAAVALRLALARAVEEQLGEPPVVLLDDPFSGLDPERRARLGASLADRGQLVIAVPDESHVPEGAEVWRVKEGSVAAG